MRIKEVLLEREMPERKSSTMPFSKHYPTMPSSDPYQIYRFGVAMADHTINYAEGPSAQHAVVVAYTNEEEDIIQGGEKQTGHRGQMLTDRQSREPNSTSSVSPVARPKRNRYGV